MIVEKHMKGRLRNSGWLYLLCSYVQVAAMLLRCDVHFSKCFCGAFTNVGGIFRPFISRMFKKMLKKLCELNFGGYMGFFDVTGWSPSGMVEKTGWVGGWVGEGREMRRKAGSQSTWARIPRLLSWGRAHWNAVVGRRLADTGSGLEMEETRDWEAHRQLH